MSDGIAHLADQARTFLEPHWRVLQAGRSGRTRLPPLASEGMCQPTALFLHRLLRRLGERDWEIVSGHCLYAFEPGTELRWYKDRVVANMTTRVLYHDAGTEPHHDFIFDGENLWGTHFWLERDGTAFDLTADQFGQPWGLVERGERYRNVRPVDLRLLAGKANTVRRWESEPGHAALLEAWTDTTPAPPWM